MNTQDLKHTKGEWYVKGNAGGYDILIYSTQSRTDSVAKIEKVVGKVDETDVANAKLIAAAPDLLEVAFQSLSRLKKYEERIENEGKVLSVNDISLMFRLEEALQKATE